MNKTPDYTWPISTYTVVDNLAISERDWGMADTLDEKGYPVIAMVRISSDKVLIRLLLCCRMGCGHEWKELSWLMREDIFIRREFGEML